MSDDTLTIALDKPIEHNGSRYTEITLREPTLGELTAMSKASPDKVMSNLISAVSGVNPIIIDKLPASKSVEALKFLNGYIGPFVKAMSPDMSGE